MIFLTPTQLANPHRSTKVGNDSESLSHFERSFAHHRYEEILEWDRRGVLEEAMAGKARSRRNYSKLLMSRLLQGNVYGFKNHQEWDALLHRLWDMGASKHTESYDDWLPGAAPYSFAKVLIAAGAQPRAEVMQKGFHVNAFDSLMGMIQNGHTNYVDRDYLNSHYPDELEARLLQWMKTYSADSAQLAKSLSKAVSCSIFGKKEKREFWLSIRDGLLEQGAHPNGNVDNAFDVVFKPRDQYLKVESYHVSEILRYYKATHGEDPPAEKHGEIVENYKNEKSKYWEMCANEAVDTLLGYLSSPKPAQDFARNNLEYPEAWVNILRHPSGVGLARKMIDGGIVPPWNMEKAPRSHYSYGAGNIINGGDRANYDVMPSYLELLSTHPIVNEKRHVLIKDYLANRDTNPNQYRNVAGAIKGPVTSQEMESLLQMVAWKKGESHFEEVVNWLFRLPGQWKQFEIPEDEIASQVAFCLNIDLIQGVLNKFVPDKDNSFIDNERATTLASLLARYPVAANLVSSIEGMSPKFQICAALGCVTDDDNVYRKQTIPEALRVSPLAETAEQIVYEYWRHASKSIPGKDNEFRRILAFLDTTTIVKEAGFEYKNESILHSILTKLTRSSYPTYSDNEKVLAVREMSRAGFLQNTLKPLEFFLEASNLIKLADNSALLGALFEEGVDPANLPLIETASTLTEKIIQAEQSRSLMEKQTATVAEKKNSKGLRL